MNLAATIRDVTAVTGDPAHDADAGDIRKATIKFVLRETGQSCSGPIGLVNTGDAKTGTATCNISVDIGQADSAPYTVDMTVDGHYVGTTNPTVVTVWKMIAGMITGGGYLVNSASAGQYAGANGQKTNFRFNVRPNKSGGVWFSSNWSGTNTVEQVLGGGNLVVR